MRRLAACWLLAAAVGCSGVAPGLDQPRLGELGPGAVSDYPSLVASLRAAGATVEPGDDVDQPFFPVTGKMLRIDGEEVQVFQFAGAEQAAAQAARISPTGATVGTAKIYWIGVPHFYRAGKLLVLYVGGSERVLKTLETAFGRQFAGQ